MEDSHRNNVDIDKLVELWLKWDKNDKTRQEIIDLSNGKNLEELKKRLCNQLSFGTAGIRSKMGAGFSMMNDLTVIQTAQGLVQYVLSLGIDVQKKGVVVGFDGRHNSMRWAQITATVCVNNNIPVFLFSRMCPTPYVAFSIVHVGAMCGVVVTASHNHKDDNGYKVYWENGAQIVSPTDLRICQSIANNREPKESSWDLSVLEKSILCKDPYSEILQAYNRNVRNLSFYKHSNAARTLRVVYTPLHGVGYSYVQQAFRAFDLHMPIAVEQQVIPDPDFPTAHTPNPENSAETLMLATETADATGCPVIVANDPDADRMTVAEKQSSCGKWRFFTGNELGALFGYWLWTHHEELHPNVPGTDVYMISSTVSSRILHTMAQVEGFHFAETLTGFKWMGNLADSLIKQGKTVLFAFEEAIGFMCGTDILDKDGISAAAVVTEMASYFYANNSTLNTELNNIYQKYGYHLCINSHFVCHQPLSILNMFERLRGVEEGVKYPITCGPFQIVGVRDLTTGYDSGQPDLKAVLPVNPLNQMITFTFANDCVVTLRTSGTEPKVKLYSELHANCTDMFSQEKAYCELSELVDIVKKDFCNLDNWA